MATIATDGKGNYVTLDAGGNWVPTAAPAPTKQGGGELGYQAAPPETKLRSTDIGDITASQPGEADAPAWMSRQPLPSARDVLAPAPNTTYGDILPIARDDKTGALRPALPNIIRAPLLGLTSEGPQIDSNTGRLTVPGATINPDTGTLGVTPEAGSVAPFAALPLRFGSPSFVPPGTYDRRAPLSPEFRANPLSPEARAAATGTPSGPTTETGIAPPNRLATPPEPAPGAPQPTTAATPVTPADPPIMTQAEMQAHARGFFSPADQEAASNARLPDTNAAAVRKLFSDTVPSDPERARITAGQPAIQAANNVDATGPMSYATAMDIDRDLTSRMRGAGGSDAHDLSQLQQSLRTQMDQVPDLDNLRPGRLAWMQSIKQGQMEVINYGASLKNDPAAADAYVRQRAAALLKNDNAMRNWTPEETAQLEQVARSGDIGMLGRLSVSLIKPITRVALGAMGHSIAGPMGAIVGSEIGGDVGATQAGRLRSWLSQTTLDPVMEQITRGVPPAPQNRLATPPPGAPQIPTIVVRPPAPGMPLSGNPAVMAPLQAKLTETNLRQDARKAWPP